MSWECDNHGGSRRDYLDHIESINAEYGRVVQAVERDRIHGRTYAARAAEEPVVTGMRMERARDLLNGVACHVSHDTAPVHDEQIPFRGGPLVEIVELRELAAHLHTATDLYRPTVRALQLVHTDDPGHWPPGSRVSRRPARARNLLGGMCVLMIERMFH
jgi:hypothetical protein